MLAETEKDLIFKTLQTKEGMLAGRVSDYFRQSRTRYFELRDLISNLSTLPENWDSYQAERIKPQAIELAADFLDELFRRDLLDPFAAVHVFPMRDGGVQFEVDMDSQSFEVEIKPNATLTLLTFDEANNLMQSRNYPLSQQNQIYQTIANALLS